MLNEFNNGAGIYVLISGGSGIRLTPGGLGSFPSGSGCRPHHRRLAPPHLQTKFLLLRVGFEQPGGRWGRTEVTRKFTVITCSIQREFTCVLFKLLNF